MAFSLYSRPSQISALDYEPETPVVRSPGARATVPSSLYRRPSMAPNRMDGRDIADARRARNAAEREARITDSQDSVETVRDKAASVVRGGFHIGGGDTSQMGEADLRNRIRTAELMAQTPESRAANIARGQKSIDAMPRFRREISPEQSQRIEDARRRVAMDPASQAGTGGQYDPYRRRKTGERMMDIAKTLKPGDSVSIREGDEVTRATNGKDRIPTTATVSGSIVPPPRPGTVSEDGGKTWKPIAPAIATMKADQKRQGDIYARKRGAAELARAQANLTPAERQRIRTEVYREMTGGPDPAPIAPVSDRVFRRPSRAVVRPS